MTDLATIGFKADTSGLTKAQTELKKTTAAGAGLDTTLNKTTKSANKTADSMSGFGRKAGMAGIQVEQLVGSINAGQNPMRALGFQATDLGYVLGFPLVGAIVGISASIASTLIPALLGGADAVDELIESLQDLKKETALSIEQANVLNAAEMRKVDQAAKAIVAEQKNIAQIREKIKAHKEATAELDANIVKGRELGRTESDLSSSLYIGLRAIENNKGSIKDLTLELDTAIAKQQLAGDTIKKSGAQIELNNSLIGKSKDAIDKENESKERQITILAQVNKSLETQRIALKEGEFASLGYGIAQSLGLSSAKELPEAIKAQIDEIERLTNVKNAEAEAVKKANKDKIESEKEWQEVQKLVVSDFDQYEKLTDEINNFGGAWSRTGEVVVDAFGSMGDAISDYTAKISKLDDLQKELDKNAKNGADITKEQISLDNARFDAEISGYASAAGAMSSMFAEKTAAAQAFSAIEQVLTAVSIARGAAQMFAQGGFAGFAGVAAMGAVMAGLGYSMQGSGSAPSISYNDGTGTVLGDDDAVSESIEMSKDLLDVGLDQLSELRGIRDAVSAVDASTNALSNQILTSDFARALSAVEALSLVSQADLNSQYSATGGNVIGLSVNEGVVSSIVELELLRSGGKGNYNKTSTEIGEISTELTSSVQNVVDNIKQTTVESLKSLGLGINESIIDAAELNIGNIDISGLNGDELQELLNGVFSSAADLLIVDIAPQLVKYQESGTGLLETLTRLSVEQATFNDALEFMGMSLSNVSAIMQIEVAQSVIELVGGLETFSDLTNTFFSEFLSEEEQFAYSTKSLTEALSNLGLGLFDSRDSFTSYIQALDLTDAAQQKLYAGLLELVPALDSYYDEIESAQEDALATELALIDEAKSARLSALQQEQAILSSVVSKFLPSAQTAAITALSALDAARKGDFSLANSLSVPTISASDYSSNVDYMIAQAQQSATLAEIGRLANEQLSEVDTQISLLDEQNYILTEINDNIIAQNTAETSIKNTQSVENSAKITEMQAQQQSVNESMARNIARMANDVSTIKNNGVSVYTISSDTLSVTVV